jgi:hypothetical protein
LTIIIRYVIIYTENKRRESDLMYNSELENKVYNLLQRNIVYTPIDIALLAKITIPKAELICHHLIAKDRLGFIKRLDDNFQPMYVKLI